MALPLPDAALPNPLDAVLARAREAAAAHHWLEAEAAYHDALRLAPDDFQLMREQAAVLRKVGKKYEATELVRAAKRNPPKHRRGRASWSGAVSIAELGVELLHPASLGFLLIGSMLLPIIPWLAVPFGPPRRPRRRAFLMAHIIYASRQRKTWPFLLGFLFGFAWTSMFLSLPGDVAAEVTGWTIAFFTALCALWVLVAWFRALWQRLTVGPSLH